MKIQKIICGNSMNPDPIQHEIFYSTAIEHNNFPIFTYMLHFNLVKYNHIPHIFIIIISSVVCGGDLIFRDS